MIQLKIPTIFFMIFPFLLPDNPLYQKKQISAGFFYRNVTGQNCLSSAGLVSGQGNVTQKNASQAYYIRSIATVQLLSKIPDD